MIDNMIVYQPAGQSSLETMQVITRAGSEGMCTHFLSCLSLFRKINWRGIYWICTRTDPR